MNFFDMNQEAGRIVASPMIWIYVVSSVTITVMTMVLYYWLVRRGGTVYRKLAPSVPVTQDFNFRRLTRLLTSNGKNEATELEDLVI
jgi:hypothetical protein